MTAIPTAPATHRENDVNRMLSVGRRHHGANQDLGSREAVPRLQCGDAEPNGHRRRYVLGRQRTRLDVAHLEPRTSREARETVPGEILEVLGWKEPLPHSARPAARQAAQSRAGA